VLVVLGVATMVAALLEGTAGDWSAVQLARLDVSDGLAPLGTAAFMAGMLAGRLVGDRNTDRHGGTVVLQRGMALAAFGLLAGAAWGEPLPFLAGIAIAGFGMSGFFPLAFSAASRVPGIAGGAGAAVVSLTARAGFLIEPPIVGNIAEALDLRWSFALAGLVAAGLALAAPKIVPG
jgi:fucose permease